MILSASLEKNEILNAAAKFPKADPSIVELVIYAFYLVERIKLQEFQMYSIETVDLKDYIFSDHNHSFLNPLARLPNGTLYYLKSAYDMLFIE